MNKWLSVELSLLLLVSLVAFAGFASLQSSDDDFESVISDYSGDELTGELKWRGGQKLIDKTRGKTPPKPAPAPPKPTPLSCVVEGQQLSSGRTCCSGLVQRQSPPVFVNPSLTGPTVSVVTCVKPAQKPTPLPCVGSGQYLSVNQSCCSGLVSRTFCTGAMPGMPACFTECVKPAPTQTPIINVTRPISNITNSTGSTGLLPARSYHAYAKCSNDAVAYSDTAKSQLGPVGCFSAVVWKGNADAFCRNSCQMSYTAKGPLTPCGLVDFKVGNYC